MGKTYVAANCTNRSDKHRDVTFHSFPNKGKDEAELKRYDEWVKQVQKTRAEWNGPASQYAYVCSDHFTPDCYEIRPVMMKEMGFSVSTVRKLKPSAVPTLFSRGKTSEEVAVKKRRTAYDKRERQRAIQDALSSHTISQMTELSDTEDNSFTSDMDTFVDDNNEKSGCVTSSTQTLMEKKNKKVQVVIKGGHKKATQTESIRTQIDQCVQVGDGTIHSSDESFESSYSQSVDEQVEILSEYLPSPDSENEVDREEIPSFEEQPSVENSRILDQPKFIVFWSALQVLLSWTHCPSCGSHDIISLRRPVNLGTLLTVKLFCESCGKTTEWKAQPFVRDYPAGNILLSAAVLFSGSMFSKVLRLFNHMRLACIEKSTFFRHQKELLFPAINKIWNEQQQNLIGLLRARGDALQ